MQVYHQMMSSAYTCGDAGIHPAAAGADQCCAASYAVAAQSELATWQGYAAAAACQSDQDFCCWTIGTCCSSCAGACHLTQLRSHRQVSAVQSHALRRVERSVCTTSAELLEQSPHESATLMSLLWRHITGCCHTAKRMRWRHWTPPCQRAVRLLHWRRCALLCCVLCRAISCRWVALPLVEEVMLSWRSHLWCAWAWSDVLYEES